MKFTITAAILLAIIGSIAATEPLPVTTVDQVDLDRYCGTWYEIARLPNRFQSKCVGNTTAEYSKLDNGDIKVINRCRQADGSYNIAEGIARKQDANGSNARLKVRFAPSWLSWLPSVWGKYWIIDLAPDYSYAAVGDPSRKYLWILSRAPQIDSTISNTIIDRLKNMGFQTEKLLYTNQTPPEK